MRGVRSDRINEDEPRPEGALPGCPGWLDDDARSEWDRISPILSNMGLLTAIDGAALALYCSAHSRLVKAERELRINGMVTGTARGGLRVSPYVRIAEAAAAECKRLLAEFGGTPSSRSGLAVATEGPKDELADFLNQRRG